MGEVDPSPPLGSGGAKKEIRGEAI